MHKNKILEKLLAIILIFTLTSANFAFVTKTYASSFAETIFGSKSETGHKNIGFETYFEVGNEKQTSIVSDVNNQELAISMDLNVSESGYLKDAKIAIEESEEGNGLNFKVKDVEELDQYVQSFEDNVMMLQQINNSSDTIKFSIPIEFKNESYIDDEDLSKDFVVKFSGIYVDNDGEENEVSRDVILNISWKDEREVKVETSATKYIDFGDGVILQTLVKVDNTTENENTLPIKESEVTIDVPNYEGVYPSNVYVVANSTQGTNGKNVGEVTFGNDNWEFNSGENKLTIKVNNEKQLVKVDEYEDEYLQDADKEVIEEERYYNGAGVDEYLITYTYRNVNIPEEAAKVNQTIDAKVTTFSGVSDEANINIVESNNNYEYTFEGQTGDLVSLNIENETREVSKAYAYVDYNNSDRYEVLYTSELVANISYAEIVNGLVIEDVDNSYIDKEGNYVSNSDLYYKNITVSKENFDSILGENGEIKVLDENKNELVVINNQTEVNEEGNIVITLNGKYSKLTFETSKPVSEGNLVIKTEKAMKNSSLSKSEFENIASFSTKTVIKANYEYVDELVEVNSSELVTNFVDTTTKATLVLDRDNLSTLEKNENVEMRIELNNATEKSDVYGHSEFNIELPESVESYEITSASILYAEGLEITSVSADNRTVTVVIDGTQEGINSGVLTNGTNIVLNANIKVNLFTPAKEESFTLNYSNDEATNYEEQETEFTIDYSAPTGLVTVNSISNYDTLGSVTTSVRQGEQEDLIDIYSDAKIATMEVIVMNNNNNTVSNLSILGRIPFAGVKDIATGEDLGTTTDTTLVNGIVSDERNNTEFVIYYSENGEATKDLNDSKNGWVTNPESFENIKSYLIVPTDSEYEMEAADILRFTYEYEIPANLTHNEEFYGTFLAYYTNNTDIATIDEESTPDLVGLTTGEGPELSLNVSTNKTSIKEKEEIRVRVSIANIGSSKAENIYAESKIPAHTKYVSTNTENDNVEIVVEDGIVKISAQELQVNEVIDVDINLTAQTISSDEEVTFKPEATVEAKDLGTTLTAEGTDVEILGAEIEISQYNYADISSEVDVYKPNEDLKFRSYVRNLTDKDMTNLVVSEVLPNEVSFVEADIIGYEADGLTSTVIGNGTYDESTRTVTWNFDKIEAGGQVQIILSLRTNILDGDLTYSKGELVVTAKADGTDTYSSNTQIVKLGKPVLVVTQTTDNTNTYVKEGEKINYIFTITNEGKATADHVTLSEEIPDGVIIEKMTYSINGIIGNVKVNSNKDATVSASIPAGSEMVVNVQAVAASLNGVQEKAVTNYATVSSDTTEAENSNEITHIIELSERNASAFTYSSSSSSSTTTSEKTNVSKTYKITGTAWLDENQDGMRSSNEELLSGISIKLVDSETGVIQKSTTTDASGNYAFSGIENGNYLVIFDYDTVKYTVTTYKKDGVDSSVNSDAVTTKLEQEGKTRNGAISDVIKIDNGSVSGIDIGFVLADTFDLKLDKTITKVTAQTSKGTNTDSYDGVTFAKTEIAAKNLSGSTVYVEYTFTVSNIGDVKGYAKKVVDYLPEGMTFNSSLDANSSWYTGSDGNLYSTALADTELAPGETATIKLILTKQMTETNTGLVNNLAEIYDDYNIYGISDTNSTPGNKAQGENDLGSADLSIGVKTGEVFIYISVIITTILLGSIVIFIAYNKIVLAKRKGGV